jgi:hypothetical protein
MERKAELNIRADRIVSGFDQFRMECSSVTDFSQDLFRSIQGSLDKSDRYVLSFSRETLIEANYTSYFLQEAGYLPTAYTWKDRENQGGCLYGNKMSLDIEDYALFDIEKIVHVGFKGITIERKHV